MRRSATSSHCARLEIRNQRYSRVSGLDQPILERAPIPAEVRADVVEELRPVVCVRVGRYHGDLRVLVIEQERGGKQVTRECVGRVELEADDYDAGCSGERVTGLVPEVHEEAVRAQILEIRRNDELTSFIPSACGPLVSLVRISGAQEKVGLVLDRRRAILHIPLAPIHRAVELEHSHR